jgi:flagellar biosynthetic protein FliR
MPQMNVFMLGMPIKIILGLSIIFITISAFKGIVNVIIQGTYEEIYEFLRQAKGS